MSAQEKAMSVYEGEPLGRREAQKKAKSGVFVVEMGEAALAFEGLTTTNDCGSEAATDGAAVVEKTP